VQFVANTFTPVAAVVKVVSNEPSVFSLNTLGCPGSIIVPTL
jgi:hypothetical protein